MPSYKLRVLKMGQVDVPGAVVYWMDFRQEWVTLYYYMIVLEGAQIAAIINTGLPDDLRPLNLLGAKLAGERCRVLRSEQEKPLPALASIGIKPEQLRYVLITPFVSYANANVALFRCTEKIFISRRGWIEDIFAPQIPSHAPREVLVPDDVLIYLTTEAFDRVHLVDDEEEVLPGIRMFWVGVHHRSSMAISVPTKEGRVIISDCFFKYDNIEKDHPLGIQESMEECRRSYARIRREADVFVPLYDPEVLRRFPGGVIG
jgi:glyoxylase-like metal-dependent hydrolase (beta-lactamase superfamily II)